MEKIIIDKNYYLTRSQDSWNLHQEEELDDINEKTGKPKIREKTTYHGNLRQALREYMNSSLKVEPTLEGILKRMDRIEEAITHITILHGI